MKFTRKLTLGMVWTACVGLLVPTAAFGSSPLSEQQAKPAVRDVALKDGGQIGGRVVNAHGIAVADAEVVIRHEGKQVAHVVTDAQGTFVAQNLRGGLHSVSTPNSQGTYRFWTAKAAPPVADPGLHIVDGTTVRGQGPGHGHGFGLLANPWVIGLGVAAAIAIPLALDDDDDAS